VARAAADRALLAIDAGSSRTRVTLLAASGEPLAAAAAPTPSRQDRGGAAVLSGEQLWEQVVALVRETRPWDFELAGVGVAAQLGVVLVDEAGHAVEDALLWPDGRAAEQARELSERLGPHGELLGRPVSVELPACKVMWWTSHRPRAMDAARWVLSLKDFLVMKLTGVATVDETHASYTGWFDVAARAYSPALVECSGVAPELLPPVRVGHDPAGAIHAPAARALGVAEGVPVAVGGPDGAVGALGAGAIRPGVTVDVAGTTDVVVSVVGETRWAPGQAAVLNAYVLGGQWAVGGPTGMTGGAVEWVSRLLGFSSASEAFAELGEQAMALPVGCDGLVFDPALSGSRFPGWSSGERGVFAGLRHAHGATHLLRAAHEGAAFVVLEGIDAVRAAGAEVEEIVIVGGVASRMELVRLRSDLWGLPVRIVEGHEATTAGAAMLAGLAASVFEDPEAAVRALAGPALTVAPREEVRGDVAAARARWQASVAFARELGR
jgi:xylulokinase